MEEAEHREKVAAAALAEVNSPRLAITEQFFAVHRLAEKNPVADIWRDGRHWYVSLRLHGEPYFWVAVVEQDTEGLRATWGYSIALANVYLAAYSETLTADQITAALSLEPYETRRKGDLKLGGRSPLRFDEHRWYYRPDCPEALGFERKLARLLEDLLSRSERYRALKDELRAVVSVSLHDYAGGPSGWHLDSETITRLNDLGLQLGVDLWVSGPEMPDEP